MRRKIAFIGAALLGVAGLVGSINYFVLQQPLSKVLHDDPRNAGISAVAHFAHYVDPSGLVFDLRGISGETREVDVARVLLQYSEALKARSFSTVTLAHRGTARFQLEGEFFKTLGNEFGVQNPLYTLRTLPQNVQKLDGTAAFGTWQGGVIGVAARQMGDLDDFHRQWWLDDELRTMDNK